MRWHIMSCLIWIYTISLLVFKFSVYYNLYVSFFFNFADFKFCCMQFLGTLRVSGPALIYICLCFYIYASVSLGDGSSTSTLNSLTTKKQMTKFSSANFQKILSPSYIILRIQILGSKQCRNRWGGLLWATSSRSKLFANSAIFVLVLKEIRQSDLNPEFGASVSCVWPEVAQFRAKSNCCYGSRLIWVCKFAILPAFSPHIWEQSAHGELLWSVTILLSVFLPCLLSDCHTLPCKATIF